MSVNTIKNPEEKNPFDKLNQSRNAEKENPFDETLKSHKKIFDPMSSGSDEPDVEEGTESYDESNYTGSSLSDCIEGDYTKGPFQHIASYQESMTLIFCLSVVTVSYQLLNITLLS